MTWYLPVGNDDVGHSVAIEVTHGNRCGSDTAVVEHNRRVEKTVVRIHEKINCSVEFILSDQIKLAIVGNVSGNNQAGFVAVRIYLPGIALGRRFQNRNIAIEVVYGFVRRSNIRYSISIKISGDQRDRRRIDDIARPQFKFPMTIAGKNLNGVARVKCRSEIEFSVMIEIGDGEKHCSSSANRSTRAKCAVPVAEKKAAGSNVGYRNIERAIVIEVSHGEGKGIIKRSIGNRKLESPVAIAEQNMDIARPTNRAIRYGDIKTAVMVEVGQYYKLRIRTCRVSNRRLQSAIAFS